jgi:hypothetical protein
MRKAGVLVVLAWSALGGSARADEAAPTAPAERSPASPGDVLASRPPEASEAGVGKNRKMDGGAAFLLMPIGKANDDYDLAFAYGVGVSLGYRLSRGLSVGLAPQVLFNIKHRDVDPQRQYDLMARMAYTLPIAAKVAVYGEILPGYSIISPPRGDSARGFVVALGAGAAVDVTNRVFANLGVGYQWGFQTIWVDGTRYWDRDRFLRVALGGGMRM